MGRLSRVSFPPIAYDQQDPASASVIGATLVNPCEQDHPDWNIMLLDFGPFGLQESEVEDRVVHIQSQNRSIQGDRFTW